MEPQEILNGKRRFVEFLKSKGYREEKNYEDHEYDKGIYFRIRERKLLVVYEVFDMENTRNTRNHFLIEKGLAYCAIVYDKKIIFFRNFGEGKYFLYSDRTKDNITKVDKLRKMGENFDGLFQRKDISGIFYEKFKLKRDLIVRNIKNKIKPVEKYLLSQKIFDRIFFTYFLCHKGIITFEKGGSISGENLFKIFIDNGDFFNNLKNLFHRFNSVENRLLHVGDYTVKIPYLNGGLFRPDSLENELRFSLSKKDWKAVLDFLNQYHWIIEEDVEIAIEDGEKVLTPEILGHVYERSVVEWEKIGFVKEAEEATKEKSERKKKGVYYTPEEITSYIARKTILPQILTRFNGKFSDIDELIETGNKKELEETLGILSKMKVLDPACGSGAFLIKASELLFQLKVRVRKNISKKLEYYNIKLNTITDNIHGVDILEGAVEITKLRLWLWLVSEYREGAEIHSLPNIEYNIRVGNSLIGWTNEKFEQISLNTPLTKEVSEIFLGLIAYSRNSERKIFQKARELLSKFNLEDYITAYSMLYQVYRKTHGLKAENLKGILEKIKSAIYSSVNPPFLDYVNRKIKPGYRKKKPVKLPINLEQYNSAVPFHWRIDFGQIMNNGGFDIVIGNPPYVFSRNLISEMDKKFFSKNYKTFEYQPDLYILFLEKSTELSKNNSFIGLIVSNAWFGNLRTRKIREFILENTTIKNVVYCPKETFNIGVETAIIILKKKKYQPNKKEINVYEYSKDLKLREYGKISQSSLLEDKEKRLNFRVTKENLNIIKKIEQNAKSLIEFCDITRGVNAYDKYRGQSENIIKNRLYHSNYKVNDSFIPELKGKNVKQYCYTWAGDTWIKYGKWLAAPRNPKYFEGDRIILRQIPSKRLVATVIKERFCIDQTVFIAKPQTNYPSIYYLLGIVNSRLIGYYFRYRHEEVDEVFPKVKLKQFKKIPIKIGESSKQKMVVELAKKMISLNKILKKIGNSKTDEKTRIEHEITKVDKKIDNLIYKIYGMTEKEKKIIDFSVR